MTVHYFFMKEDNAKGREPFDILTMMPLSEADMAAIATPDFGALTAKSHSLKTMLEALGFPFNIMVVIRPNKTHAFIFGPLNDSQADFIGSYYGEEEVKKGDTELCACVEGPFEAWYAHEATAKHWSK